MNSKGFSSKDVVHRTDRDGKPLKHSGKFEGHSNKLGHGGRFRKLTSRLKKEGESEHEADAVAGMIARRKGAAPGGSHYHGKK